MGMKSMKRITVSLLAALLMLSVAAVSVMFGTAFAESNAQRNASAFEDSNYQSYGNGFSASAAIDGDMTTAWQKTANIMDEQGYIARECYMGLEWQSAVDIDSVSIWWRSTTRAVASKQGYTVQTGVATGSGVVWTDADAVYTYNSASRENGAYVCDVVRFNSDTNVKLIRILIKQGSDYTRGYSPKINELTVEATAVTEQNCDHEHTTLVGYVAATCTKDGYSGDTVCQNCGKVMSKGYVLSSASAHNYSEWQTVQAASEGRLGVKKRVCSICRDEQYSYFTLSGERLSVGLEYKEDEATGTAAVAGIGTCTDTEIIVPSVNERGFTVTEIKNKAFYCLGNIKSVYLPDTVTTIGNHIFHNCYGLESVRIPDGVTSLERHIFRGCVSLRSIDLPDSVKYIGNFAFADCVNLQSITLPNGLVTIGASAFYNCTSLKSVNIPSTVTSLGGEAFCNCTSLKSISIPAAVGAIGDGAFLSCTSLTTATVANGVKEIGYAAFAKCTALTSLSIPQSVTYIGDGAFYDCSKLDLAAASDNVTYIGRAALYNTAYYNNASNWDKNVLYWGKHLVEARANVSGSYTVKAGTLDIAAYAFSVPTPVTDSSLTAYSVENPTTFLYTRDDLSYSGYSYSGCRSLTSISLPQSLKRIGEGAFYNCTSLSGVDLTYVTEIGGSAFYNCTSLSTLILPFNIKSVGDGAFDGCTGIVNIDVPDGLPFMNADLIRDTAFYNDGANRDGKGSLYLGGYFIDSEGSSVVAAGKRTVAPYAFYNSGAESAKVGSGVIEIGEFAFFNNDGLTYIELPASLKKIDYAAFDWCQSLTDVYYAGTRAQWNEIVIGDYNDAIINATVHYEYVSPADLFEYDIIGGSAVITSYIGSSKDVVIPQTIESKTVSRIASGAFDGRSDVTSVMLPVVESVTYEADKNVILTHDGEHIADSYQQSNNNTYPIAYAFDGDTATRWQSKSAGNDGADAWIGLRFNGAKAVSGLYVDWETAHPSTDGFKIQILNENSEWVDVPFTFTRDTSNGNDHQKDDIMLVNPVTAYGIRVYCFKAFVNDSGNAKANPSVWEMEVYGVRETRTSLTVEAGAFAGATGLKTVYFGGTDDQWNGIGIGENNDPLINAARSNGSGMTFLAANISLSSDLSISYYIRAEYFTEQGWSDPYIVFNMNGTETVVSTYTRQTVSGIDAYKFTFKNIAPDKMSDVIYAVPYGTRGGSVFAGEQNEFSIKQYCHNQLRRYNASQYASLRTLLVDLLNYGAASQEYTGHNTNALCNADLTDQQRSWGTQTTRSYVSSTNTKFETVSSPTASWKSAGLVLNNAIDMNVYFDTQNISGTYVLVRDENGEEITRIYSQDYLTSGSMYYVKFNGYNSGQLSDVFLFSLHKVSNDKQQSNTLAYSVESYANSTLRNYDESSGLARLVKAMMNYGDSAYRYVHG